MPKITLGNCVGQPRISCRLVDLYTVALFALLLLTQISLPSLFRFNNWFDHRELIPFWLSDILPSDVTKRVTISPQRRPGSLIHCTRILVFSARTLEFTCLHAFFTDVEFNIMSCARVKFISEVLRCKRAVEHYIYIQHRKSAFEADFENKSLRSLPLLLVRNDRKVWMSMW